MTGRPHIVPSICLPIVVARQLWLVWFIVMARQRCHPWTKNQWPFKVKSSIMRREMALKIQFTALGRTCR